MKVRTKFILTYVGGIITGVVLTFAVSFVAAMSAAKSYSDTNTIEMFDEPTQEINIRRFVVIQVLDDGSALATSEESGSYGTAVLFAAEDGDSYYDEQKITVPSGKCLKQVGTYRYVSRQDMNKTVPVVKVFDE